MTDKSTASQSASNVQPLRSPEQLLADYLDLADQIKQLTDRANGIKAQLGDAIGVGNSLTVNGVTASVREPNRTFDVDAAWATLTDEQKQLAMERSTSKVKAFIPPVLAEQFMRAGKGGPIVSVR